MSARLTLLALTVALATLGGARGAAADVPAAPTRLAILASIVHRTDGDVELGAGAPWDEAAAAASWIPGLTVVPRSELAESGLDEQLRQCGSDVRCIAGRLREHDVGLGLLLVADLGLRPPMVTTRVVDARAEKVLGTSVAEVGAEALRPVLRAEVTRVLGRAGHAPGGRLTVETTPGDARLSVRTADASGAEVEVRPESALATVFVLAPGAYALHAERDGYAATLTQTVVRAGYEARVWLELEERRSVLGSPWFWVAVVGVAALAGGAVLLGTRGGDGLRPLCQTRGGAPCE